MSGGGEGAEDLVRELMRGTGQTLGILKLINSEGGTRRISG